MNNLIKIDRKKFVQIANKDMPNSLSLLKIGVISKRKLIPVRYTYLYNVFHKIKLPGIISYIEII